MASDVMVDYIDAYLVYILYTGSTPWDNSISENNWSEK